MCRTGTSSAAPPVAAATTIATGELLGLRQRLSFWKERLREMVDLDHDTARRLVRFNDRSVRLSRRESQLIEALIAQRGQTLAVRELLRRA